MRRNTHFRKSLNRHRGASNLTTAVFGLISIAIIYSLYIIIPIVYGYYELKNQIEAMVRLDSNEPNEVLRKRVLEQVRLLELPARAKDILVERAAGRLRVQVKYNQVVAVPFAGYEWEPYEFKFVAVASGAIKGDRKHKYF